LLPLSKTEAWWEMDWMRRHIYFLPRYDEMGRRIADGHALAAEEGIAYLMRRTYRQSVEPAPLGVYDFVNYFECADEDVSHLRRRVPPCGTSGVTRSGSSSTKARLGRVAVSNVGKS
jgi:hypothetical protein